MPDETTPVPKKAKADDSQTAFLAMFAKNPLAAVSVALLLGGSGFGGFSLKQNTEETMAMRKSIEELRVEVVTLKSSLSATATKVEVMASRQDANRESIKEIQTDLRAISREIRNNGLSLGTGAGNGRFFAAPPVDLTMKPAEGKEGFPTP